MKYLKLTSIALLLAIGVFFFASPVHASEFANIHDRYRPDPITYSQTGLVVTMRATMLYPNADTSLRYGSFIPIVITMEFKNPTNNDIAYDELAFQVILSYTQNTMNYTSFSSDLVLGLSNRNGIYWTLVPSADYTYNGKTVIPAHSSLWFSGEICIEAPYGAGTNTYSYPNLEQVSLALYNGTTGSYPVAGSGSADLSALEDAVDDIYDELHTISLSVDQVESYLSGISSRLTSVVDLLTYSGSTASMFPSVSQQYSSFDNFSDAENKFRISGRRLISTPIIDAVDSFWDTAADAHRYSFTGHYDIEYFFLFNNTQTTAAYLDSLSFLNVTAPHASNYQTNIVDFDSNVFDQIYIPSQSLVRFIPKYRSSAGRALYPQTGTYAFVKFRYNFSYNQGGSFPVFDTFDESILASLSSGFTATFTTDRITVSDSESLRNLERYFREFLDAYSSADRSDLDQQSDDIGSTSDAIHTQEQQFFNQNSQAIAQTGLSNYRFSSDQTGGISAVSNDFTAVFNALGGFNSVFVFSLTLALALRIIRHGPIVRSRKVNDVDPGGD